MSETKEQHSVAKIYERLIAEYKEDLKHKEIKDAVRELREKYAAVKKVYEDLSYFKDSHRDDNSHD